MTTTLSSHTCRVTHEIVYGNVFNVVGINEDTQLAHSSDNRILNTYITPQATERIANSVQWGSAQNRYFNLLKNHISNAPECGSMFNPNSGASCSM